MTQVSDSEITVRDGGVLAGPIRQSVNTAINAKGSIHDTATATKLGLRGGTVAGSIHMDLFPPVFLKAFGQRWFERGTLSLYFINATIDREPVQAFVKLPPEGARDAQVDVWVDREDGMRVAEGSASVGNPLEQTALLRRPLDRFDPGELRILKDVKPGDSLQPVDVTYTMAQQKERLGVITEKLDWYEKGSPWGAPIVTPAGYVNLLYAKSIATMRANLGKAVGLFGAIEIRNINGPLKVDQPYRVTGDIVATGQSPKTEYFWFETAANDADGKRVAEMRMLLRFMKASSPRYQD
jgi:hypothetical protein